MVVQWPLLCQNVLKFLFCCLSLRCWESLWRHYCQWTIIWTRSTVHVVGLYWHSILYPADNIWHLAYHNIIYILQILADQAVTYPISITVIMSYGKKNDFYFLTFCPVFRKAYCKSWTRVMVWDILHVKLGHLLMTSNATCTITEVVVILSLEQTVYLLLSIVPENDTKQSSIPADL